MKILVISAAFPPMKVGGADYALKLCQCYAERGAEVDVITTWIPALVTDPVMRIHPVMHTWGWREFRLLMALVRQIRPDVVDIHFQGSFYQFHPMITFAATFIKRALPGVRVVTHIEWPLPSRPHTQSRAVRLVRRAVAQWAGMRNASYGYGTLLRDSDAVIVLSDTHRAILKEDYADIDSKAVLIPPAPLMVRAEGSPAEARAAGRTVLGEAGDAELLVFFGYVYPGKGIETLLRALHQLAPLHPKLRLVVIGAGLDDAIRASYYGEMQALATDLGLDRRIHWTGYYEAGSDRASLFLHASDCCVLPFDHGVFLNNSSFAAAMSHGLPTVTTPGDPLEPQFRGGVNLLFSEAKNVESLAAAIASVLSDGALRNRLHEGALAFADEWFSLDRSVERTMAVFRGE